eukprot:8975137-Prorocentrum_lima.AAC.1
MLARLDQRRTQQHPRETALSSGQAEAPNPGGAAEPQTSRLANELLFRSQQALQLTEDAARGYEAAKRRKDDESEDDHSKNAHPAARVA